MKKHIIATALLALVALTAGAQTEQTKTEKKERIIALWGHVKNSLTRVGIPDVFVTLMTADSTVVDTMRVFKQWNNGKDDYAYRFDIPAREQRYIIRADHPDYEPCYVDYHVRHIARNEFFDAPWHYMKKRTPLPPAEMEGEMGEFVVRATKVKMFYNGDTITFNADALNLPEGSMLDELIRQLDGVELKDDGRILVNGTQVDELMLNGKDFFKGNNRVMLDNLPAYTVKRVQTYHKSTELDEYLGLDHEKKRFVMDVQLKHEYNQGWLGNIEGAGGWKDDSRSASRELMTNTGLASTPYLGRLFAMRYTTNSRISVYGNVNNVNEQRRPGSNGEWQPGNAPQGLQESRLAGANLFIEEKDKRWKEDATIDFSQRRSTDETLTAAEQFHTDAPSTFNRQQHYRRATDMSFNARNNFQLNKPFFLRSEVWANYNPQTNSTRTRSAQFGSDPAGYGRTTALLDSVFSATLSTDMQQSLIHSNLQRSSGEGKHWQAGTNNNLRYKLASGDDMGMLLFARHIQHRYHSESEQDLRYQLMPSLNSLLARHASQPSRQTDFHVAPSYRLQWLNGMWVESEYRFLYRRQTNTNEVFLADTLDLQNAYDRTHRRAENRLALTPGYTYNHDGKYIQAYYQMHFYNVNEQLNYASAYTDTTLTQHKWTMSPELHVYVYTHNWTRGFDFFYGIEFQTPDLFQKVNILNNENPLVQRYGNPNLRGATNHRMQFSLFRQWQEKRINHGFGGGLRFFRHQVSQGSSYDATTGITTYRPENVEGNWQTYFFNNYSLPLDKPRRLMLIHYIHGDYTRNVDIANGLSRVNNYYLENRLTLSYTLGNLTLGLPTYVEYRHTTNEERTIATINATNFQYGLTANYNFKREETSHAPRWLQGFTLATDLKMFSRRGYGDRALNRNDLVWNASIARSFLNPFGKKAGGTLVARLEGFDLLAQLSSTSIVINGQGRTETISNTLPRYLMLHLTYQWSKLPKRK